MNQRRHMMMILALAAIGLAASGYLTYLHHQLFTGQLAEPGFCGISRAISCETVSASPYSEWFGVPIAWFGAMVYMLFLSLASLALWRPAKYASTSLGLILIIAATAVAIDGYLAYIMAFKIKSLCLLCLLTYGLNLAILYLAFRAARQPLRTLLTDACAGLMPLSGRARLVFPVVFIVIGAVAAGGGMQLAQAVRNELASFDEADFMRHRASITRIPLDISSDPFLGAKDARLTIVEFSDFQCPHCRKAHFVLQTILPAYADRVKLVFKNLPLGIDCNPVLRARYGRELHAAACGLARLGEAAAEQDGFWPLHDAIFERQADLPNRAMSRDELMALGKDAGLDMARLKASFDDAQTAAAVGKDIATAYRIGIDGTPTFLFNGMRINGLPPPKVLQRIIEIELGSK